MVKIVQHFFETPHTLEDLGMILVDKVPVMHGVWGVSRGPLRRRWELVWISRLQAELNKIRDWRHSFPGATDYRKGRGKGRGRGKGSSQDSAQSSNLSQVSMDE